MPTFDMGNRNLEIFKVVEFRGIRALDYWWHIDALGKLIKIFPTEDVPLEAKYGYLYIYPNGQHKFITGELS